MKTKYIFASMAAVLALAATGCQEEGPTYLSEVTVSSSYVAIPAAGGSTTISVSATGGWTISGGPDWLTVSPASGSAGESSVTFSAEGSLDGRTGEVLLTCEGATQHINVIQGVASVSEATCAEVIAGPDSKTYRVTGTVTRIVNTEYGNWYLEDGTGEVYVYGTLDANGGTKNFKSWGLEVGDEITVEGPKTTYNGTVELVDVTVLNINKSLIKIDSVDPEDASIPADGGDVAVTLTNKGTGLWVEIPEDAADWLSIASVAGSSVVFHAAENNAGGRIATITFRTEDGGKEYTAQQTITQAGRTGTLAIPFTVAEAIEYVTALGGETSTDFYVKGVVSKYADKGEFGSQYGNGTFYISDDGDYHDDKTLDFEAYRVLWLGNQKWADGDKVPSVGDEVILCGRLTLYNGTPETSSGKAYVYSVNGLTDQSEGWGTLEDPLTPTGAIKAANALESGATGRKALYIKGKISNIVEQFGSYGNATFYMSADGVYNNDKALDFEVYRALYLGNRKWQEGETQIAVGDDVIVCGQLTLYNGTPETASGKAYVYSLNGKTE